jgi:hypothetical protein
MATLGRLKLIVMGNAIMKTGHFAVFIAASLTLTASAAWADEDKDESGKGKHRKNYVSDKYQKEGRSTYFYDHGYTRLDIPAGHYRPPGACRIWHPRSIAWPTAASRPL